MLFFDLFCHDPVLVNLKAGEYLFRAGDPADGHMYVLITGRTTVRLCDVLLETCGQGDILGEMGVISKEPRSTTVRAETDCQLARIDERRFRFLVDETPNFAIEVMKVMARRLKQCDLNLARASGELSS